MTDQSRRAQDFRRQLSWFRMRDQLVAPDQPRVRSSEAPRAVSGAKPRVRSSEAPPAPARRA